MNLKKIFLFVCLIVCLSGAVICASDVGEADFALGQEPILLVGFRAVVRQEAQWIGFQDKALLGTAVLAPFGIGRWIWLVFLWTCVVSECHGVEQAVDAVAVAFPDVALCSFLGQLAAGGANQVVALMAASPQVTYSLVLLRRYGKYVALLVLILDGFRGVVVKVAADGDEILCPKTMGIVCLKGCHSDGVQLVGEPDDALVEPHSRTLFAYP